jgi:hypothetical protein
MCPIKARCCSDTAFRKIARSVPEKRLVIWLAASRPQSVIATPLLTADCDHRSLGLLLHSLPIQQMLATSPKARPSFAVSLSQKCSTGRSYFCGYLRMHRNGKHSSATFSLRGTDLPSSATHRLPTPARTSQRSPRYNNQHACTCASG